MPKPIENHPSFPVGSQIVIIRPHLWSGCVGFVDHVDDRQMHRIRIQGKNGSWYTSIAWAEQLRWWPWGNLMWESPERQKL